MADEEKAFIDFITESGEHIATIELEMYIYDTLVQQAMQEYITKVLREALNQLERDKSNEEA